MALPVSAKTSDALPLERITRGGFSSPVSQINGTTFDTMMSDTLSTIWKPSSGRFDDGVEERQAPIDLPPPTRGSHFESLMKVHGVTEDDIKKTCCDCGNKHERKNSRCCDCDWKKKCASNARKK